ncbi:MAG: Hydrogenase/urease maturation factor HypB [Thermodesulfobacteria bacterium]|nr:hypothetical protein [Thermodesulfobacteriota bacterium]MCU4138089.1 Hydrogenase/urease maturation factor HypB [Thermodesulfobacteriota bacterium]
MYKEYGCRITNVSDKTIEVFGDNLKYNKFQAKHNRECFEEHKIYAINLMSVFCSGKLIFRKNT